MSLNDFEIGKILGKGAFATVAIVTRKEDKKAYAMKRINISKLDEKEKESALNEIRILASLSHPNIIGYKEAFFDQKSRTLNIVMEYADDGDIDKKIKDNLKKKNLFSEETIWGWIIQILEGLKYLHDNKIMHRDLKCANIFLMKNGILKLGDLNVSKIAKLGMAKTQTGTPYYISPEIWKEQPYDYKCDIWSVGCIIYEICTLRPPFRGNSIKELCNNIMNGYYLPISNYYSNDIKDIISLMLVIDNKKRSSAEELLNSNIVKKWINILRGESNNKLGQELVNNYINNVKVNLIKTIKMPKNIKDINNHLPKKKYNPSDEMMKNDKYEIMKETMKKGNNSKYNEHIDLSWLNGINNENNYDNIRNNKNMNKNKINKVNLNDQPINSELGKYAYLNKYDNKMRLKNNERENNYLNNNNNYNNQIYNNIYRRNNYQKNNDIQYRKQYNPIYNNNSNYNNNNYNNINNNNEYNYENINYRNQNFYNCKNDNNINYNYGRNYVNNNYLNNNRLNIRDEIPNYNKDFNQRKYKYEDDAPSNKNNNNSILYNEKYPYENKDIPQNGYRDFPHYQKHENNYYINNSQNNRNANLNNLNNYYKEENNINKIRNQNEQNRPISQLKGNCNNNYDKYKENRINNINRKNTPNEISNLNNKKGNRYKFMFLDESQEENQQFNNKYKNNNKNNQYNNINENNNLYHKYNKNNYQHNYNKLNNRNNDDYNRKDIGPRYNLYDFRYNNELEPFNILNQPDDEVKITFQKINYKDYCERNNFDRNKNYHFYLENGYYNYNQKMKNYHNMNDNKK